MDYRQPFRQAALKRSAGGLKENVGKRLGIYQSWQKAVRRLKREVTALVLASRHPGTPWAARIAAVVVVAYALSPIDLIPDFIPVLGYLDDLILVPLGLYLVIRLIPDEVMDRMPRQEADLARSSP